jgi:hypothetical protein
MKNTKIEDRSENLGASAGILFLYEGRTVDESYLVLPRQIELVLVLRSAEKSFLRLLPPDA